MHTHYTGTLVLYDSASDTDAALTHWYARTDPRATLFTAALREVQS